jgi:predicted porin
LRIEGQVTKSSAIAPFVALLAFASAAKAGETQPAPRAPDPPTSCLNNLGTFLSASPKKCPLAWRGIALYGVVDMGFGYSSHAAAFNPTYPQGVQELIAKFSKGPRWQLVPNGLQRSNVGLAANFDLAAGWSFIGNINTDFDPYSLRLANGPASLVQNNMRTLADQTANGDSSRAGQFDNTQGYVGIQNRVYGSLSVGRLNSYSADLVSAYDPMLGSYAFSMIGNSATYVSGVGDTETTRYESAVKYAWSGNTYRAGAIWQFGGYDLGNGSNGAVQVDLGKDFDALSLDAVYSHARDAVALSLYGANPLPAGVGPNNLRATLANIDGGILAARYRTGPWTFYGGYEYAVFSPPDDPFAGGFQSLGGYTVLPGAVNATAYVNNKHLQVAWAGARFALRPDVDLVGAYYLAHQNDYAPPTAKPGACGPNTIAAAPGATPQGTLNSYCAGNLQAVSALLDYRPFKRVDLYAGMMFSAASGGVASGYQHSSNFAPSAGLRISF